MAQEANVIARPDREGTSPIGDILRDILQDVQQMIRAEIRLARSEMSDKVKAGSKAAAALASAAWVGFMAAACFVTACIAALALAMPVWLAALAMGVLLGVVAAASYRSGRARLRRIDPKPEQTIQSIKDNIQWANQRSE